MNIREYCNRPGSNVEEMNNVMIARWNAVVSNNDTVYHLGDFAMGKKDRWPEYRSQLNGRIVFFLGNHDVIPQFLYVLKGEDQWTLDENYVYESPEGIRVSLAHLPLGHEESRREGMLIGHRSIGNPVADMYFCGHVHKEWLVDFKTGCVNVGVDQWNYIPKTLKQIRESLGSVSEMKV